MDSQKVALLVDALRAQGFTDVCDKYKDNWGLVDTELRHICTERCIGHAFFAVAYPKVVIIDEAYNAGLARSLREPRDPAFNAQRAVAEWLSGPGREAIDAAVSARRASAVATSAWLSVCLAMHGRVVQGLSTLGATKSWPTSFVSKYLHFHNANFVVYDNEVDERLRKLLAESWSVKTVRCEPLDTSETPSYAKAYLSYLNRFAYYMDAGELVRPGTTVKELDHFLWNRPEL